jgi:hypothetical protein
LPIFWLHNHLVAMRESAVSGNLGAWKCKRKQ